MITTKTEFSIKKVHKGPHQRTVFVCTREFPNGDVFTKGYSPFHGWTEETAMDHFMGMRKNQWSR